MNAQKTEDGKPGAKAPQAEQKKKRTAVGLWFSKWGKAAGAAVVGAGIIGSLYFASRTPVVETITKTVDKTPPAAVKGDGNCEVKKGEAFPWSETFDPKSCGYCGDGEINVWIDHGVEVGRETETECAADFHYCGNGKVDSAASYAGIVLLPSDGWPTYGIIEKAGESCREKDDNYCEADCPKEEKTARTSRRRSRRSSSDRGSAERERPSGPKSADCPGHVANSSRARKLAAEAKRRVRKSGIRGEEGLGATSGSSVIVLVTNKVSAQGQVEQRSVTARCYGGCDKSSMGGGAVTSLTGNLGFDGKTIDAPGDKSCTWTVKIPVASK